MAHTTEGSAAALGHSLQRLLEETATASGAHFFEVLTRVLGEAVGARYALFAELVSPERLRVVALCADQEPRTPREFALCGTIYEEVLGRGALYCESDASERFPKDPWLSELGVQGFAGIAVGKVKATPFGVLAALHDGPLRSVAEPKPLLEMFALRAAAEMKRVHLERALARQEELIDVATRSHARTQASLARLAGGVAHDFNNLLVGILGNVGFALAELSESSPLHSALADAQHAALRAADLTKQMLAYSGRGRFVLERSSLSQLLEEMTPLLGSCLSKKVCLELELQSALPDIEADPAQMRQLVLNLLTNAGDALGEHTGTVSVRTGTMQAGREYLAQTYLDESLPAGQYVFLEVSDTGPGIEPEAVAKIFDPFFTTKFTGRGLGLAAVLGILRGHRGAVRVDSRPGAGTTFRVLLPCAAEVELDAGPGAPPDSGVLRGQGVVLVADDEETVRNVATRVLVRYGFQVLIARDGAEAVQLYAERSAEIALVILDMTMPGLSGEEVFGELQRIRPDVRVILTSGYSESDVTSSFVGRGLSGFLQKPWVPDELVRTLRSAFKT